MSLQVFMIVPTERVAEFTGNFGSETRQIEPFEWEVEEGVFKYLLPYDVLADPEFAVIHEALSELEQITLDV